MIEVAVVVISGAGVFEWKDTPETRSLYNNALHLSSPHLFIFEEFFCSSFLLSKEGASWEENNRKKKKNEMK